MKLLRTMLAAGVLAASALAGCGPTPMAQPAFSGDGLDPATLPVSVRADYAVFAERCSKCHALARALASGIDDDAYWQRYVTRMRRQPASGISPEDEPPILRFLRHYSLEVRRTKTPKQTELATPNRDGVLARGSR